MKNNNGKSVSMRMLLVLISGLVICNCLDSSVIAADTHPISLVINRVVKPPTIDGVVDDACWKNAQWMPLWNIQGDAAKVGARVALSFDRANLYAAFILDEPSPEKINAPVVDVNSKEIWEGETLEWFINTVPQGSAYSQLGWNPGGSRFNVRCYKGYPLYSLFAWMPKWKEVAKIGKGGWTSEASISFAELGQKPPQDGTVWTMNLYRTRNIEGAEYSCLSPTFGGFHSPDRFVEVWFNKVGRAAIHTENLNNTRISAEDVGRELKRAFGNTISVGTNLARGGDAESETTAWGPQVKVAPEAKRGGNAGYELDVISGRATSDDLIPIVSGATYRLSGYFRSADMQKPASAYFGLNMYDAQKRLITWANVGALPGTETILSRAANIGDTVVALQNCEKWKAEYGCIAFNILDEYTDLPNFDISGKFTNVTRREDCYEVKLSKALTKFYPAGTRVREHISYGVTLYWVADNWISGQWKKYETYIGGEAKFGASLNQFWPGAKYMQIFVQLGNYNRAPLEGAKLWFDDILLEEISVK